MKLSPPVAATKTARRHEIPTATARARSARAAHPLLSWRSRGALAMLAFGLCLSAAHASPPEIRTSVRNTVPGCVTPQRLMAFLKQRNQNLDPRFEGIADWYRRHGEAWRVRWDYAFFQMAVETNFLSYKRGNGGWGDVNPRQNNFAGLGTTGGGVPGDSYPNVSTGVLAQIQHLVVYSGERIADPIGSRTKLKQNDIIELMASLSGHTTFSDLSRRWAADKHYGAAIEWVAGSYRSAYCNQSAERTTAAARTETAAAEDLPPAAALGGPAAAEPKAKPVLPVRTIWSREMQAADMAADKAAKMASTTAPTPAQKRHPATAPAAKMKPAATAPAPQAPVAATPAAMTPVATAAPSAEKKPAVSVTPQLAQRTAPAAPVQFAQAGATPKITGSAPMAAPPALRHTVEPASMPVETRAFAFAAAMNRAAAPSAPEPVAASRRCRVLAASYGGKKTLLVRAHTDGELRYTALTVLEGFERSMLERYLKANAPEGSSLGEFPTKDAALAKARELCPGAAQTPSLEGAGAG